jgi:hypothetical protein
LLRLIRLDTSKLDHFGPLLDLIGDALAEVGRRAGSHCDAQVGKPCLELGVGKGCVDLLVELLDYSAGVFLGTPTPTQLRAS